MSDYTELKRLAENHLSFGQAYTVAKPSVLLALIAENEQLAKTADCWDRLNIQNKALSDSFRNERDQLRAEVAGLRTGYEAYERVNAELKAEVDRLNEEYDKAWRHDLNDKKNVQALAAEVARLSADSEALRKDAERYRWLRQDDVEQCRISRTWSEEQMDAAIDAALGQGEQS